MAGVYDLNSLVEIPEGDWSRIFGVNLFGPYRVNRAFAPLLGRGSRIVLISSELAPLDPLPFTGIYGITKAALEKYAFSLRMELQILGVGVSVIRSGAVDTQILDISTQRLNAFCESTKLYACNAERFRKIVERVEARKVSSESIARVVCKALKARHPRYVYNINRNPLLLLLNALPARLQTALIRQVLKP
jgi:NAD(P)-dependent dehydrogenase (short-subunit alcohol dehydrogenase family)